MNELISELVGYGIEKGLVEEDDKIYVINRLLDVSCKIKLQKVVNT
jgi:UDPglucose--hexose-1-phosphate uridylyltransferase